MCPLPSLFAGGWKRGSRSRSGQRFAPPPSAADCPPRDREPLFTLAWLGATNRFPGYRGGEGGVFPSSSPGGRCRLQRTRPEGEGSMVLRRTVCGEAVERSAGRRRTIDPSPFYTQEKESLPPLR